MQFVFDDQDNGFTVIGVLGSFGTEKCTLIDNNLTCVNFWASALKNYVNYPYRLLVNDFYGSCPIFF